MENEKEFTFTIEEVATVFGVVTATSKEEALEKIKRGDWDDLVDVWNTEYNMDTIDIIDTGKKVEVYKQ